VKLDPTAEEEEDPATAAVHTVNAVDKRKDSSVEFVEKVFLDLDDDGASTLVGHETNGMFGEKEIDMEVTDSDGDGDVESPAEECGVKRKRTIRVIIRSRAFL
jgi:hypothetical protein